MPDCLNRDVIASRRLPLEEALSIYILPTAGCLPIYLLFILVRHETKEITAHVVIIEVGLVFVLPAVYELIRQCVNEKPPIGTSHFLFQDRIILQRGTKFPLQVAFLLWMASISGRGFVVRHRPPLFESG